MKLTQEQAIAWAQESGALIAPFISLNDITFSPASLQDFAALAYEAGRKDENEACAKVCEDMDVKYEGHFVRARLISEAIRARREQ